MSGYQFKSANRLIYTDSDQVALHSEFRSSLYTLNRIEDLITIYIGDLRIDGPIVTLTDVLVAFLCFRYTWLLHKGGRQERIITFFKIYFFGMGLATLIGGIVGHAFLYAFSWEWKLPGWVISMVAVMFVERASIEHTRILLNQRIIRILKVINIVELALFLFLVFYYLKFIFVEIHLAYGMLVVVASLELLLFFKARNPASKNMVIGVALVGIAAYVFMGKVIIHEWFNHMVLSHLFLAVASYFFYMGAKYVDLTGPHGDTRV